MGKWGIERGFCFKGVWLKKEGSGITCIFYQRAQEYRREPCCMQHQSPWSTIVQGVGSREGHFRVSFHSEGRFCCLCALLRNGSLLRKGRRLSGKHSPVSSHALVVCKYRKRGVQGKGVRNWRKEVKTWKGKMKSEKAKRRCFNDIDPWRAHKPVKGGTEGKSAGWVLRCFQ